MKRKNLAPKTYHGGLLRKIFGSFFVAFGAGIIMFSKVLFTGYAVAADGSSINAGLVLSFMLVAIGLAILASKK
jgi:hypothetical protein